MKKFNERRRYKVLPLMTPFTYERSLWKSCVEDKSKIEPIFNRDGMYMDRKLRKYWIEVNGEAWLYNDFEWWQFELNVLGTPYLHPDTIKALTTLKKDRLLTKKQALMLYWDECKRQIRQTGRTAKKHVASSMRRAGVKFEPGIFSVDI